jgi:tRNA(Ile)-lysidine synthase
VKKIGGCTRLGTGPAADPALAFGVLFARVRRTIAERGLVEAGDRVLVACSGGPDSAVLLHVLARLAPELRLTLFAASVDHGLRADADRDVAVARALAERLEVPFAALRVEVPRAGASVQAKARAARYRALAAEAARLGAARVAVGHTLDDQAETVLSRLLRGAGVRGLAGVAPRREDGVVRPLVDCRRAAVHAHAARFALPHVRDPSNDRAAFERVRLRTRVLPALEAEDARVVEHLARLADEARALRGWVREDAERLLREARAGADLRVEALREAPGPVRAECLARWVRERTGAPARRAHVEGLDALLSGRGEVLLPGRLVVERVPDPTYDSGSERLVARFAPSHPTRSRARVPGPAE